MFHKRVFGSQKHQWRSEHLEQPFFPLPFKARSGRSEESGLQGAAWRQGGLGRQRFIRGGTLGLATERA